jgi:branched-chain amino acid transport system substrate-binding protein
MRHFRTNAALLAFAIAVTPAFAADIKIAQITDQTGPLAAYAKQSQIGFMLGLEYATGGTMQVGADKLVVIQKDSKGLPDAGKALLTEAYADDKVAIAVGGTSSAVALAMLPVALQYKKVMIVEPAVADSITGSDWNRYIFRTARNSSQDAISNAVAIGGKDVAVATLAQDYAFGRDFVAAFREALAPSGAKIVYEQYEPMAQTDFTAAAQRLFDALKNQPGKKYLFVVWAGASPLGKLAALDPGRYGIQLATGGNILSAMTDYKAIPGMEGATYYYYDIPKNPVNDWLVTEHMKRYNASSDSFTAGGVKLPRPDNPQPDFFTAGGMTAGIAVVAALKKAGATDTEALIKAMEGMEFQTPKGTMVFRKEDHQALQSMYAFKIRVDPAIAWGIPALTRELTIKDMNVPIRVN